MAIEYRDYGRRTMAVMTACPFCDETLSNRGRVFHFVEEHGPEVIPDV
jgi:hypothetical protein